MPGDFKPRPAAFARPSASQALAGALPPVAIDHEDRLRLHAFRAPERPALTDLTGVPSVDFLGIPLRPATVEMAIAWVDAAIHNRSRLCIGVVNAAKIVKMRSDPEFRSDVLGSET